MKKKSSIGSLLIFLLPFLIAANLMFFAVVNTNQDLQLLLNNSFEALEMSSTTRVIFSIAIGSVGQLLLIFVAFIIFKVALKICKASNGWEEEILITQLVAGTLTYVFALFSLDFFPHAFNLIIVLSSILELVIFLSFSIYNIKDKKALKIIIVTKLLLFIFNLFFAINPIGKLLIS